jgi:hypothetical protein
VTRLALFNIWSVGRILHHLFHSVMLQTISEVTNWHCVNRTWRFCTASTKGRLRTRSWASSIHFRSLQDLTDAVFPFSFRSSKPTFSERFSHQNSVCIYCIPQHGYMPRPSWPPTFHYANSTRWPVWIGKFLVQLMYQNYILTFNDFANGFVSKHL